MPISHRFPVLIWQDHQAGFTARVLDRDEPAGIGKSADAALDQLRDYLEWLFAQQPWGEGSDFEDPELVVYKVPVRPEYVHLGRRFPCDESITLRVHAVRGRQEHGLLICAIPTLNLRFYYHDAGSLKNLVIHYVQQQLESLTPQQLARFLPPLSVSLEYLTVNVRQRFRGGEDRQHAARTLLGVAEALGDGNLRRQYSKPYERDRLVTEVVRRLQHERANILLLGDSGVGKTTILVEAVRQLERTADTTEGGPTRSQRKYWQTSGGRLIAGMKYLGQWEERCEQLIAEIAQMGGVLCIDNLLDLVQQGGRSPTNSVAAFFLPYLQRGELRLVAEATPDELAACRRLLPGLADVFQILAVPPFNRQEAINVLEHVAGTLKQNHRVEVARGVIDLVYHLHRRFIPYGAFPGKAAAFLTTAFENARQARLAEVDLEQVMQLFVRRTGLPELFLRDDLPLDREEVLAFLRREIIGQEDAILAAANLITTYKAALNDPHRPIGVLLFCGPTGVGKTQLAKALARFFFGHGDEGDRLVRLDMSEYTGWRAGDRLMTQADGQPSDLIKKLRQKPFSVVLLDEVEKADPEVFDVLMGVFDEGRLTDRFGRLTSFKSAVIIMTSNLGAGRQATFGFLPGSGVSYQDEAMKFFRPEFFNRMDGVVTFQPLGADTIRAITAKELREIAGREGLTRLNIRLTWTDVLVDHLAKVGFDERYGARPLQRALETAVVTPLARWLLDRPQLRDAVVCLDVHEGQTVMTVE